MKPPKQHQRACESTSTNFQDDLTIILENPKIRVLPKILIKLNILEFVIYKLVNQ